MKTILPLRALALLVAFLSLSTAAEADGTRSAAHSVGLGVANFAMVSLDGPDTFLLRSGDKWEGTTRLQYTAVNSAGKFRAISVQWRATDRAPAGTSLRLAAVSVPAGCGAPVGEVVISDQPAAVIADIPSCATGRGASGALLRYRLSVDDASKVREGESTVVTLVFTISPDM